MQRNFAVISKADRQAEGVDFKAGDRVAVVTTEGEISLLTLLGMVQFHHADVVEITDEELIEALADNLPSDAEDAGEALAEGGETAPETQVEPIEDEQAEGDPSEVSDESGESDDQSDDDSPTTDEVASQFVELGLDEKLANSLAEIGETPASIDSKVKEGYDLEELENIGPARVKKILAVFA